PGVIENVPHAEDYEEERKPPERPRTCEDAHSNEHHNGRNLPERLDRQNTWRHGPEGECKTAGIEELPQVDDHDCFKKAHGNPKGRKGEKMFQERRSMQVHKIVLFYSLTTSASKL